MNKKYKSYEDEAPQSNDNYAAKYNRIDYNIRKEDFATKHNEIEGFFEALMWCVAVFTIMIVGAIVLTW